jgi:hypothetical protein
VGARGRGYCISALWVRKIGRLPGRRWELREIKETWLEEVGWQLGGGEGRNRGRLSGRRTGC